MNNYALMNLNVDDTNMIQNVQTFYSSGSVNSSAIKQLSRLLIQ